MGIPNESELSSSSCIYERTKRQVVLHIVRYLVEITKRFSKEDRRDIICRVLHHQRLNEDMGRINFGDQCVSEEIVESMKSSLDLSSSAPSISSRNRIRGLWYVVNKDGTPKTRTKSLREDYLSTYSIVRREQLTLTHTQGTKILAHTLNRPRNYNCITNN